MNRKGFTLTELLATLVLLGIIVGAVLYIFKGTMATSMTQIDVINDTQVFEAAKSYVLETNKTFQDDYTCVTIQELVDYGYFKDGNYGDKIIKIIRNPETKVYEEVKYVDRCN